MQVRILSGAPIKELFKWYMIALAIIFVGMFVTISIEEGYSRDKVVACYEAGKLNCEQFNK
jgi:hypothetical protein